ncbi:hypothetical protein MMC27_006904 [Xylographa pallens]|nr:hypothetical protein [Xylographa pallens]
MASSFGNVSSTIPSLPTSSLSTCDISCIVFAGGIPLIWPATTISTTVTTVFETVFANNGTQITSAQPLHSEIPTTTYDPLYVPSLYVNGTVTGNGVEFIYPTAYVGIQDFQAVTDCSIPGCTAVEDCNPQAVNDYVSRTGFPYAGITTAGYYYINAGIDFGGSFNQDEVQQFLSLLDLPSGCPVVLEGPPYTLMPVAQLTETYTITSSHQGQTPSPVASPGIVTPSTTLTPPAPYYLTTGALKTNTIVQPLVSTSPPAPDGVTLPTASVPPNSVSVPLIAPAISESPPIPPSPATTAPALSIIALGGSTITENSVSQYAVGSKTLVPGGPAITVSGTIISLATSASAIIVNGVTQSLPQVPSLQTSGLPPKPFVTIGGSVITPNTAGLYLVGTQTLVAGGPAITVAGAIISLATSAIIVNGLTQTLSPVVTPSAIPPLLTIGSSTITANPLGQYLIGTQSLTPGGPAITVSGTTLSLAPSASVLIVNGNTQTIRTPPTSLPANPHSTEPPLILGSIAQTANSAGAYILGTQALIPGGPGITISGTTISLASSDVAIIVNGHTYPAETNPATPTSHPAIATVDGDIISVNSAGAYEIGSQTITPGGPAITIDGTPVSLQTVGTGIDLVVAESTKVLTVAMLAGGLEPSSTGGLGGIIFSGLVGLPMPSGTGSVVVDTSGARARREMHWWSYVLLGTLIVLGGLSL